MLKRLSFLFFFTEIAAFLLYLTFVNNGVNVDVVFFWAPMIAMIGTVLYQVIGQRISGHEKLMLLELFLFAFALHLVIARPGSAGLAGHDPHFEYSAAEIIMNSGWPVPKDLPISIRTRNYSEWPMIHFLTVSISEIVGIDLFTVAKWLPAAISSFVALFLYLFSRTIYGNKQVAFFTALASSALFPYLNMHSKFVRESFAFVIFFACLFMFVKARRTQSISSYFTAILLAISLVFFHHFTSFVLLLFMFTAALLFHIVPKLFVTGVSTRKESLKPSYNLVLFLFFLNVSYWAFIGEFVPRAFFLMMSEFEYRGIESYSARRFSPAAGSPRMVLASYGNLFFLAILGLFTVNYFLKSRKRTSISDIVLVIFGGGLMVVSYASLLIASLSGIDFTRFATFGYFFILVLGVYLISKKKHEKTLAILVGCFILLQVFTIPAYLYDVTARPEYEYGGYREYFLPQEYSAVGWFNLSGKVAGDWTSYELFAGLKQIQVIYKSDKVAKIFEGNTTLLNSYDWLIFRHEDFEAARVGRGKPVAVTIETYNKFNQAVILEKVYNNGEVEIYRSSPEFHGFP